MAPTGFMALAAAGSRSSALFRDLLPWLALLLGIAMIGAIVLTAVRRLLRGGEDSGGGGFTLHELRQMHARGELSDEEFARAREAHIAAIGPKPDAGAPGRPIDEEADDPGD